VLVFIAATSTSPSAVPEGLLIVIDVPLDGSALA